MVNRNEVEIVLTKLVSGDRILRLCDPSGLVVEKKVDPKRALHEQKENLFEVLSAALAVSH